MPEWGGSPGGLHRKRAVFQGGPVRRGFPAPGSGPLQALLPEHAARLQRQFHNLLLYAISPPISREESTALARFSSKNQDIITKNLYSPPLNAAWPVFSRHTPVMHTGSITETASRRRFFTGGWPAAGETDAHQISQGYSVPGGSGLDGGRGDPEFSASSRSSRYSSRHSPLSRMSSAAGRPT